MFCVLVIIFRRDDIPGSRFFLSQRDISIIAPLSTLKPVRGRADSTHIRSLGSRGKRPHRSGSARIVRPFCMAFSLIVANEMGAVQDHERVN